MQACAAALRQRRLLYQVRRGAASFDPTTDTNKVMTMHAGKGLEFSVGRHGVGQLNRGTFCMRARGPCGMPLQVTSAQPSASGRRT